MVYVSQELWRRSSSWSWPFCRDCNKYGLKVRQKVRKPRTKDSTHGLPVFPNLIKDYIPLAPNRLWVSDITYITIWIDAEHYHFCYLSLSLMHIAKKSSVGVWVRRLTRHTLSRHLRWLWAGLRAQQRKTSNSFITLTEAASMQAQSI